MPSTKSRADVIKELEAWKRNPVTADGWREVGGDAGWSSSKPTNARQDARGGHRRKRLVKRNPVSQTAGLMSVVKRERSTVSRATRAALRERREASRTARSASPAG